MPHCLWTIGRLGVFCLLWLVTAGWAQAEDWPVDRPITVGFDVRNNQREDTRQYRPLLDYLARVTGYRFEIRFTAQNESIVDLLGQNQVQFAFVGADTYLQAHQRYGAVTVVRGLNTFDKAEYQSVIVVSPKSAISGLDELRGRKFAFGSQTSTQGRLIPLIILAEQGIGLNDLAGHVFTGSHRNCAQAVVRGEADACGMQDTLGRELAEAGLVRILATSRYFPSSGVAAAGNVPPVVIDRVKKALLDFQPNGADKAGLYNWTKTEMPNGFTDSNDSDYADLREWSKKLGLL